ncbi:HEPN domain-containing protein [bacterium]|nr:MAG: HEPN domain-containing protein [bacterium]
MLEHEKWLVIAHDDLKMAKLALPQELFSPLTYHCQQVAEKSLKGYHAFKKQPIMKTHDLAKLLEVCLTFDRDFEKLRQSVSVLNPYASKFRYPTEFEIPDEGDAELAIKHAEMIMNLVLKNIGT